MHGKNYYRREKEAFVEKSAILKHENLQKSMEKLSVLAVSFFDVI